MGPSYRAIGIDPALTHCGVCVLEGTPPTEYRVTAYTTIKTRSQDPMLYRVAKLREGLMEFWYTAIVEEEQVRQPLDGIAVEDPTGQVRVKKKQSPHTIAIMSLAVGAALATLQELVASWDSFTANREPQPTVAFIDTDEWMPKETTGHFTHIMKRERMDRYLLSEIRMPRGAGEHVLMAAGVARYWMQRTSLEHQRRRQGIPV